jgi:predicted RecB family nuclease
MLGKQHEKNHLESFPDYIDLSAGSLEERLKQTRVEVGKKTPIIYQPILSTNLEIDGVQYEVVGQPDFMIYADGAYIIRDSKLSRRIDDKDHPEIIEQLQLYGWLFSQNFMGQPFTLQVHSGTGEIVDIPYDGGTASLESLADVVRTRLSTTQPYNPVGWSKCNGCGYQEQCWKTALEGHDVAIVPGIDQSLAVQLHQMGIPAISDLLERMREDTLAEVERPWGKRSQRVGKKAGPILIMAQALAEDREIALQPLVLPDSPNYVMFDLEGLPPQFDELGKIYLWGIQVFGEQQSDYLGAVAGFGEEGDKQGWRDFLFNAKKIFDKYGDIPFVHWSHYERTQLDTYIKRYGDIEGIAERVRKNLLDLLPIVQKSIALPIPSYSLKVIEDYVGFKRTQDEYGGDWAIAKYIEATETGEQKERDAIVAEILTYNKEDLEATWAVLQWLKSKA